MKVSRAAGCQPQTITHFQPVSTPFDVLLLFDRSTSTGHETSLMRQAAKSLIGGLRPEDRVGLATYAYAMQVTTRWTDTRRQVLNTAQKKMKKAQKFCALCSFLCLFVVDDASEFDTKSAIRDAGVRSYKFRIKSDDPDFEIKVTTRQPGTPCGAISCGIWSPLAWNVSGFMSAAVDRDRTVDREIVKDRGAL